MLAKPSPYLRFCPGCQAKVPLHIKICWSCGEILACAHTDVEEILETIIEGEVTG